MRVHGRWCVVGLCFLAIGCGGSQAIHIQEAETESLPTTAGERNVIHPQESKTRSQETTAIEVTVYHQATHLEITDRGKGPRQSIPLQIDGSAGLKLAFLARATGGITTIPLNMFDGQAGDNKTPRSYAHVGQTWRPVVYHVDRFRYNSSNQSVRPQAIYKNVAFYGRPTPGNKGVLSLRNVVVYRGEDTTPPEAPIDVTTTEEMSGVKLSWSAADDNVGVATYVISRASGGSPFVKIAQSALPRYVDMAPSIGDYRYRVLAVDFQDNLSPWSKTTAITLTKNARTSPAPSIYEEDRLSYAQHIRNIHASGKGKVVKGKVLQFGDSLTGALNYMLETEAALGRYILEARGRSGWKTDQGRTVIATDIKEVNPEFCLILYGTNNPKSNGLFGWGSTINAAMEDMLTMAKACEDNGTVPVIATIPPRGFTDPQSQPEADYNAALIKMCRANKIPIAYLFEEFQAQPDRRKLLYTDGVHWGVDGFSVASQVWRRAMDQVTFVLLDRPD